MKALPVPKEYVPRILPAVGLVVAAGKLGIAVHASSTWLPKLRFIVGDGHADGCEVVIRELLFQVARGNQPLLRQVTLT